MAQGILIEDGKTVIDPDHVSVLSVDRREIRIAGTVLKLSERDFNAIYQAKVGRNG